MTEKQKEATLAEFGDIEGAAIIAETEAIEEHCRRNNIKHHSIDVNGNCNMGCC